MAKGSSRASTSNSALTNKVRTAEARAAQAQAKVNLVRAQIEVKGKRVVTDWTEKGPVSKVVDGQK